MARILIVDDDPGIYDLFQSVLTARGHEVLRAVDPQDFLRVVRQSRPDLIVMDMQMPGGGAPMVKQMLEANPDLAALPTLFCSGMKPDQMRQWFPAAPNRGYLAKPARTDDILAAVDALLAGTK